MTGAANEREAWQQLGHWHQLLGWLSTPHFARRLAEIAKATDDVDFADFVRDLADNVRELNAKLDRAKAEQ